MAPFSGSKYLASSLLSFLLWHIMEVSVSRRWTCVTKESQEAQLRFPGSPSDRTVPFQCLQMYKALLLRHCWPFLLTAHLQFSLNWENSFMCWCSMHRKSPWLLLSRTFCRLFPKKMEGSQLMVGNLEVIAREWDRLKKITWFQKFHLRLHCGNVECEYFISNAKTFINNK